jgi:hypothetical protein
LDQITAFTERNLHFERQLPAQFSKELCARPRFSNDQCACRADIHDIIGGQFSGEHAWTKRPVPSNVDPSEENHERHNLSVGVIIS